MLAGVSGALLVALALAVYGFWPSSYEYGESKYGVVIALSLSSILFALFFTIPSATVLVLAMSRFMRSQSWAERYWAWGLAAVLVGMPASLFGGYAFTLGRLLHLPTFAVLLAISIVCGLIARKLYEPRDIQISPRNPSTMV